ncbi:MAG: hypothetical protein DME76_15570 [Verrucomicrobia bacterium]|nr:MAG: hypothetical protein DME76_15570 [Verrucomicrobiota bacterium]
MVCEETKRSSPLIVATNAFLKTTRESLPAVVRFKMPCRADFLSPPCPTPLKRSAKYIIALLGAILGVGVSTFLTSYYGNGGTKFSKKKLKGD